jgi:hypothetical protein
MANPDSFQNLLSTQASYSLEEIKPTEGFYVYEEFFNSVLEILKSSEQDKIDQIITLANNQKNKNAVRHFWNFLAKKQDTNTRETIINSLLSLNGARSEQIDWLNFLNDGITIVRQINPTEQYRLELGRATVPFLDLKQQADIKRRNTFYYQANALEELSNNPVIHIIQELESENDIKKIQSILSLYESNSQSIIEFWYQLSRKDFKIQKPFIKFIFSLNTLELPDGDKEKWQRFINEGMALFDQILEEHDEFGNFYTSIDSDVALDRLVYHTKIAIQEERNRHIPDVLEHSPIDIQGKYDNITAGERKLRVTKLDKILRQKPEVDLTETLNVKGVNLLKYMKIVG